LIAQRLDMQDMQMALALITSVPRSLTPLQSKAADLARELFSSSHQVRQAS
jgi:hypothetical protein